MAEAAFIEWSRFEAVCQKAQAAEREHHKRIAELSEQLEQARLNERRLRVLVERALSEGTSAAWRGDARYILSVIDNGQ